MEIDPFENIEIPDIVYKYRDWDNGYHRRLLTDFELFLASPKLFNDPFDCKLPIAYWKLAEDQGFALEHFANFVDRQRLDLSPPERKLEVDRLIKEGRYKDDDYLKLKEHEFFESLNGKFGVLSLTPYRNSVLMWSHYSNSHRGICIGFDAKTLFTESDYYGQGGKVIYEPEFPTILPTEDSIQQLIKQLFIKSSIWEYEQEYRIVKFEAPNKTIKFSDNSVREIILGASITEKNKTAVIDCAKTNFPKAKIFQATPTRNSFSLSFSEIE